jgi:hypothetical protein
LAWRNRPSDKVVPGEKAHQYRQTGPALGLFRQANRQADGENQRMLRNPMFVGEALTAPDSLFAQIVHIIEEGGWTVLWRYRPRSRRKETIKPG